MANFSANTMISVMDFAENYSFEVQNEVQSMHCTVIKLVFLCTFRGSEI